MIEAKPGARKAQRTARTKSLSSLDEQREAVDRTIDETVEEAIDDLVERSPGTLEQSLEAGRDVAPVDAGKRKLVRDRFTMPKHEHRALGLLKTRLLRLSYQAKKNELLRAGVAALARMSDDQLLAAIAAVPDLEARPSKSGTKGGASRKR